METTAPEINEVPQIIQTMNGTTFWKNLYSLPEVVTFESFLQFWVIYFFIIWITLVVWVIRDVTTRSSSFLFQFMCILFSIVLWPLWLFLYLIVRPRYATSKKFVQEIEHNLSVLASIVEDSRKWVLLCPRCSRQVSHTSKICMKCKTNLEKKCENCHKTVLHTWKACPFCSTKIKKTKKKKK